MCRLSVAQRPLARQYAATRTDSGQPGDPAPAAVRSVTVLGNVGRGSIMTPSRIRRGTQWRLASSAVPGPDSGPSRR